MSREAILQSNNADYLVEGFYIEITNACNYNCTHCYNNSGEGKSQYVSLDVFKKALESLKLPGSAITLSGGEPLLHPQLEEMLEVAYNDYKIKNISVLTNGALLDRKMIELIKHFNVRVQISIEGATQKSHDQVRGIGSYHTLIKKTSILCEANVPFELRTTLTRNNQSELKDLLDLTTNLGATRLRCGWLVDKGRGITGFNENRVSNEDYYRVYREIDMLRKKYSISVEHSGFTFSCPILSNRTDIGLYPRISVFGDIYLCQAFNEPEDIIGNLHTEDLISIVNGKGCRDYINKKRNNAKNRKECSTCICNPVCEGGCPALDEYAGGFCEGRKKTHCAFIKTALEREGKSIVHL